MYLLLCAEKAVSPKNRLSFFNHARCWCRLPKQEHARGYTAKDFELQAERMVQDYKDGAGRRPSVVSGIIQDIRP
jgi:hypothetical protein